MHRAVLIWGEKSQYETYRQAILLAGGTVLLTKSIAAADRCDALLLPGGGDLEPWRYGCKNTASHGLEPERDAAELALLDRFSQMRKPILGICRGLQGINVAFGGTLFQNLPGHSAVNGIDRLHRVCTAPSFLRTLYGPEMLTNSAHHQAVYALGAGLEAIQWAPDGTVEALRHSSLPIWAVQWHPERITVADGNCLFRAFLSLADQF